ncbi:MAG: HD-GYP domain-containing protein [bacterium]
MNRLSRNLRALASFRRPSRATLLRRFTLLSLVTTIVVGVVFGVITARLVEKFAIRGQARATSDYVLELAGARLVLDDFLRTPRVRRIEFERAMRDLSGRTDIVHVTVWSREGAVLYDDAHPTFERRRPAATHLTLALAGQLRWQLVSARSGTEGTGPLLEVFIPVVVSGMPEPVAIYQVFTDLSEMAPALARLIWSVQISVVLGVLMLYAALFAIVRAASSDLERKESALRHAFVGIIRSLVNALDMRDMATAHHSSRVADNGVMIARALRLDEAAVTEVQIAGILHDVGKIGIRDELLSKEGPLTVKEREMIQQHTVLGYDILDPVAIPEGIKLAVRHSHERWDGCGYPDGLAGEQIPLAARIIAVADAYEALTTERPYRSAQTPRNAMAEIVRNAGTQFDPKVVDAALRVWKKPAAGLAVPPGTKRPSSARSQRAG